MVDGSVCTDLMKHSSSAIFAVHGISSLTVAPLLPCFANLKIEPASGSVAWFPDIPVSRWPMRTLVRQVLAVEFVEQRLVVEQVELRSARRS